MKSYGEGLKRRFKMRAEVIKAISDLACADVVARASDGPRELPCVGRSPRKSRGPQRDEGEPGTFMIALLPNTATRSGMTIAVTHYAMTHHLFVPSICTVRTGSSAGARREAVGKDKGAKDFVPISYPDGIGARCGETALIESLKSSWRAARPPSGRYGFGGCPTRSTPRCSPATCILASIRSVHELAPKSRPA